MKPLTIEIHGTGTHNRGAELMAIAIAERMRTSFPEVRLVVPPTFGTFNSRAAYGLHCTWDFPGHFRSRLVIAALRFGHHLIRDQLGVVDPNEIDVVLDASGFLFSDQWGSSGANSLLTKMNQPNRRKKPLILLPQALGPFENSEVAIACRNLFARAEFVCARDDQSFAAANNLGGARSLLQYPDFTLGVRPTMPDGIELPERFAAVVPNYRMLDKTGSGEAYIEFIKEAIRKLAGLNLSPVFVLHDAEEDRRVIEQVTQKIHLPIVTHHDPRVLKGILGRAEIVIGSRFHALVSALSQGVPCIGAGWSHKYTELFHDFEIPDLLLDDLGDLNNLASCIEQLAEPAKRAVYSTRISAAAEKLKMQTAEMWQKVEDEIHQQFPSANECV